MIDPQPFTGPWHLSELNRIKPNGLKVFSTFACGGGSTMGYKLAGYDVIGALEIEKRVSDCYIENLSPKYHYQLDIREFNKQIKANPEQFAHLMDLDVLDGSPPCSQFSMAGHREKNWGKEKLYGEGKHLQTVDDLFFHFIDTVKLLQPKVVIAENVKGMITGKAKGYVKEVIEYMKSAGYKTQLFLLDAQYMGVPQRRQRVFFIATKDEQTKLKLKFNESIITVENACKGITDKGRSLTDDTRKLWQNTLPGKSLQKEHMANNQFNQTRLHKNKASTTIPAMGVIFHWNEPRHLSSLEFVRLTTFPDDYQFAGDCNWTNWVCGMSVPPYMIQRIALEVGRQWFGLDYNKTPFTINR